MLNMKNIFNTYLFRVILIPAGVFVSVLFGGGASTGLEITTYMTSNGPVGGLVAIGCIAFAYSLFIFLCYELARLFQVYEYQGFARLILGSRAWILYDVMITLAIFGVIAYSITGGATAMANQFDLPHFMVTAAILLIVITLLYQGRHLVEMSMLATTLLLLTCAALLVMGAINAHGQTITQQLADSTIDAPNLVKNVGIYAVAVSAYVPTLLYASRELKTRAEVLVAACASGIAMMLAPLAFHLAYLGRYPEILDQAIPNAWIAADVMPGWFSALFVLVLNIVILQTAVGLLQGIIERLDAWSVNNSGNPLSRKQHGLVSAGCMVLCLALSTFGIQKLLGWMYDVFFWLFLVIVVLPLFTVGVYRIWTGRASTQDAVADAHPPAPVI